MNDDLPRFDDEFDYQQTPLEQIAFWVAVMVSAMMTITVLGGLAGYFWG